MKVVAPEETVGFQRGMTKPHALSHLERQGDGGKELPEAPPPVPAERLHLHRDGAKSYGWMPEFLLVGQDAGVLIVPFDVWGSDEVSLGRTD